jgi:hypothetical protein
MCINKKGVQYLFEEFLEKYSKYDYFTVNMSDTEFSVFVANKKTYILLDNNQMTFTEHII